MTADAMTTFEAVRERILTPAGLDLPDLSRALGASATAGSRLADLFFESKRSRTFRLEDGRVVGGSFQIDQGVGARLARGAQVAFAHSAALNPPALATLAEAVRALDGGEGGQVSVSPAAPTGGHQLYPAIDLDAAGDAAAWIAILDTVDRRARAADPRIVRVNAFLRIVDQAILVADLDGRVAADMRPTAQLFVDVVAESGGRRARGQAGLGGRHGAADLSEDRLAAMIAKAVGMAIINLDARPAPTGTMPIVLGPGYPGVLFHEAVGHGLEGDHHRKKLSAFDGKLGQRIAASGVTVVDDGAVPGSIGSLGVDDEGAPGQRTTLIEDGVLTGLLQDRLNAGLMNMRPTGNGRRQSYAHLPMPRMTNTFLVGGRDDPVDIVASVKDGLYATAFGGGQVDIVTGRFNFSTTQAWMIENGRLTAPVDGATLIGVGHEALKHISMVGDDPRLDEGVASCSKQGQHLDVAVGQPTIRIDQMMVGGAAS
ncbi:MULTISPECIES: metallopeptidase TldD-related protein [Caulobacter]|jgi:TldD protein|uniref:Microcin-processing peptidase 2 n=2 Tax=Caulobacter TaxID=75 RepID=R0CZ54_CAUVI|nr:MULTISPECIES: metallopeptidase TldD-related protein [Caulobacter]ENZ81711.1 microcin-processing peptidase 2 [Caulobacter vibrioides OR37]MBQ1561609.1 metalloprotease TldD [Caulobacter sp.]